jgi:hypothetical protein
MGFPLFQQNAPIGCAIEFIGEGEDQSSSGSPFIGSEAIVQQTNIDKQSSLSQLRKGVIPAFD